MADDTDTERTVMKTYVPRYQKQLWLDEAERLDMTQSEFLRTMVQAGRRDLLDGGSDSADESTAEDHRSRDVNPWGDDLETQILIELSADEYRTWEELRDSLIGDLDDRLDEALVQLDRDDKLSRHPRDGSYRLTGADTDG